MIRPWGTSKGLAGTLIRSDSPRLVEQPTGLFQSLRNSLGQGTRQPLGRPQEISSQVPEEDPHSEFAHIRLLMGAESYYLYDDSAMTDAYARWAFLAAEDDPVAAFIECVREESSVYPRPMARESLANDPFRMKAEAVEAAFAEARAQGRADDIERVEASNGDVYFYSTTYLTPRRAQALAEWDAVERIRNV